MIPKHLLQAAKTSHHKTPPHSVRIMSERPVAYLSRKQTFTACRSLHSDFRANTLKKENFEEHFQKWSWYDQSERTTLKEGHYSSLSCLDGEAKQLYGRCKSNDQEQNYAMEVTLRGPVSEDAGVVMNARELKALMAAVVRENLNKDAGCTTENMSVLIWNSLKVLLPDPEILHEVKVYGTDSETASYRGETLYV